MCYYRVRSKTIAFAEAMLAVKDSQYLLYITAFRPQTLNLPYLLEAVNIVRAKRPGDIFVNVTSIIRALCELKHRRQARGTFPKKSGPFDKKSQQPDHSYWQKKKERNVLFIL